MLTMTTTFLVILALCLAAGRRMRAQAERDQRLRSRLIRTLHAEARTGAAAVFRRRQPFARSEALFPARRAA